MADGVSGIDQGRIRIREERSREEGVSGWQDVAVGTNSGGLPSGSRWCLRCGSRLVGIVTKLDAPLGSSIINRPKNSKVHCSFSKTSVYRVFYKQRIFNKI